MARIRLPLPIVVLSALWFAAPGRAATDAQPPSSSSSFGADLAARRARYIKEGARPQAVVPLLGALESWELLDDRAPLIQFLDEAAANPAAGLATGSALPRFRSLRSPRSVAPEVRARAQFLRSLMLDRLGKSSEAERQREALGFITRFWVLGPFDNEGRTGHATPFAPEKSLNGALDTKSSWQGKERPVGWRLSPAVSAQGRVSLDTMLRPDSNATAYLTATIKVPTATRAAVRVGSSGAVKIWVNGQLAIDHEVYRPLGFDQDAGACELAAGANRITVKLSVLDGVWTLLLRLSQPDGAPLVGMTASVDPADFAHTTAGKPARFTVAGLADLGRELDAWARSHPRDAQAWSDLGLYLHQVAPDDPELHHAADALQKAVRLRPSPDGFLQLARAQSDPNDQRRSLEEGLSPPVAAHAPATALAPLYDELGELYHRARRERRAEELWNLGQAADPGYWPIGIRLAELAAERGIPSRAAALLTALGKQHPTLKLLRAEAALALRRGRRTEAQRLYQRIATVTADDAEALRELYGFARATGAVDAALGFIDLLARAHADVLQSALDRADVLEGAGRAAEAHLALASALAVAPEETRLLERDGKLLHRLGREAEALTLLRRALEVRPQNPELRAYLGELEPKSKQRSDLARGFTVDVTTLLPKVAKADPKKGDSARVLLDQEVVHVLPNGLSESFHQRVVQILDERGAREQNGFEVRYTPDTQAVELRAARVYKKSGEVVEATSTGERDVSEPWYGLYYDVKAEDIGFDALEPGDVIDIEYVLSDVARRNMFADYFGELHEMQEELPRLDSRYVLIAPKNKTLYFNTPRLKDLHRVDESHGDEAVYTFRATNIPKIEMEPGMPGLTDVAAYIHVSTYRTWDEVATWYRGLVAEQLQINSAMKDAVLHAVKGLATEPAKIRAVYDLVVARTRYVGLEFGIHGYQPYKTTQVFARKFGDCKDKASLLVVLLKQIGVDASLVLARTRHGGDLDSEPASLAPFDHAIVYVPKHDLWLDGTAEFSGADELPAQDQDIPVLVVQEGKLRRTPVLPAARNRVITEQRVQLIASGAARVEEEVTVAGEVAHEWRSHYQSPGERLEKYGKAWNAKHPGARVDAVDMPALADLERPVTVRAAVEVPDWGHVEGNELVLPAIGREADMLRSYARLSSRKHDLVLGFPWQQHDRVRVTPPPGYRIKRLPEARTVTAPFGHFSLIASEEHGEVVVDANLQVDRHRIAREDYQAFRRFCADVDAVIGQELVLQP